MPSTRFSNRESIYQEIVKEFRLIASIMPIQILTWRIYWYSLPISLLTTTVFIPRDIDSAGKAMKWLLLGLISHLSMSPFILYAKSQPTRQLQFLLSFLMGVVRGGAISLIAPILGLVDPVAPAIRMLNSGIAVFYWIQILVVLIFVRSAYKMRLQELLRRAIFEADIGQIAQFSGPSGTKHSEIIELIAQLKLKISTTGPASLDLEHQVVLIDELIDTHIKPQSSKRWANSDVIWPKLPIRLMLLDSLSSSRIPIVPITLLTFPFSIVGAIVRNGFLHGFYIELYFTALAFGIFYLLRNLIDQANGCLKFNLSFIIVATVVIYPTENLFITKMFPGDWSNSNTPKSVQALSTLLYVVFLIAGNFLLSVQKKRGDLLDRLEGILTQAQLEQFLSQGTDAKSQGDLAQYLHAQVQAQLHACKLLLLKAAETEFKLFSPQVTDMVVKRLESLQVPYTKTPPRIPSNRIHEIAQSWVGLSTIRAELPPELDVISPNGEIIAQLVEESVVNSIRHGKAKFVNINGSVVGGICHMVVTNDGELIKGSHKGLGTILFDTFADTWEIKSELSGTRLTFSLPMTSLKTKEQR
jgi:hypothetical protein